MSWIIQQVLTTHTKFRDMPCNALFPKHFVTSAVLLVTPSAVSLSLLSSLLSRNSGSFGTIIHIRQSLVVSLPAAGIVHDSCSAVSLGLVLIYDYMALMAGQDSTRIQYATHRQRRRYRIVSYHVVI